MRKIIAAINMTLDGYCDHTAISPGEDIHEHYTELMRQGDAILYGRITYQLMEFWIDFLENPSDEKSMNDFAKAIDGIQKIVFSSTLKETHWKSAKFADQPIEAVIAELKGQEGRDILVGSRSLIVQLLNLNLLDELQLCIHPVLVGEGLPLFEKLHERKEFRLDKTKTFQSGAIIHYYSRA